MTPLYGSPWALTTVRAPAVRLISTWVHMQRNWGALGRLVLPYPSATGPRGVVQNRGTWGDDDVRLPAAVGEVHWTWKPSQTPGGDLAQPPPYKRGSRLRRRDVPGSGGSHGWSVSCFVSY